jgi:hypothetical protein
MKITLLVLLTLIYIGLIVFTVSVKETDEKNKDGTITKVPMTNWYKVRSIIWFTMIGGVLANVIINYR